MRHALKKRDSGFSLIELVVTISIVAILAGATTGIVISLMQIFVYSPREMKAKAIAHDVIETMTEGITQKRGMRYAMQIQDASPTQFTYTFGYPGGADERNIRFRWDSAAKKIYLSYTDFGDPVNGPQPPYISEESIPYYTGGDISITENSASPNTIFKYYSADGTQVTGNPVPASQLQNIRRVEMAIVVRTGSGAFGEWQSSFKTTSGVDIKQYI